MSVVDLSSRKEEKWSFISHPRGLFNSRRGGKRLEEKMFVKCVQNNQVKGKKFTGYGQILLVFL